MSEQNGAPNPSPANATPADAGATGQQGFKPPEGYGLYRTTEWETNSRKAQQADGMRGFWDAGQKYGIKSPEDFDARFGKLDPVLKKHNLDYDKLVRILDTPDPNEERREFGSFDPEELAKHGFVREADIDKKLARLQAEAEHKRAMDQEKALIAEARKGLDLSGLTPREKKLAEAALDAKFSGDHRGLYDEKHPLSGDYMRPFDSDYVTKAITDFKTALELEKAEELAEIGKATAESKPPAGNSGQQGKPKEAPNPREKASKLLSERIKKRSGSAP